jgi:hypothetical protein
MFTRFLSKSFSHFIKNDPILGPIIDPSCHNIFHNLSIPKLYELAISQHPSNPNTEMS